MTIGKDDKHWDRVLTLPNLEELTLHEPTQEQLAALTGLRRLKRLRVTHARPKNIEPLAGLNMLEELVMEYVSGFSELSPLQGLANLRAVHLENLRRVSCFEGLPGDLRYLSIQGTLDWNQPIRDFEFLRSLPKLEILNLWTFINKSPYPALLPALHLTNLKKLHMGPSYVAAEECALLEEALPGVAGVSWGPYRRWTHQTLELARDDVRAHLPVEVIRAHHPEVSIHHDGKRTMPPSRPRWRVIEARSTGLRHELTPPVRKDQHKTHPDLTSWAPHQDENSKVAIEPGVTLRSQRHP